MAYGELLRALEQEVRDQCRALEEEARREAARIAEEGRRLAAAAREEALAAAAAEAEAARRKAARRAEAEAARAVLLERHRLLDEVRERARAGLPALSSPALTCALLAEALEDDDGSPLRVTCDPGHAGACRDWLARERPGAAGRAEVSERSEVRGGVEVAVGDALVVDDTLPARLDRAWPSLQAELGRRLFGEER